MHILEVGCGNGTLISMLNRRAPEAFITGIDRSATAIRNAAKKVKQQARRKRIELIETTFSDYDPAPAIFDKIIAFDVRELLPPGYAETQKLTRLLRPGGQLNLFFRFPFEAALSLTAETIAALQDHLCITARMLQPMKPVASLCVIATRSLD